MHIDLANAAEEPLNVIPDNGERPAYLIGRQYLHPIVMPRRQHFLIENVDGFGDFSRRPNPVAAAAEGCIAPWRSIPAPRERWWSRLVRWLRREKRHG